MHRSLVCESAGSKPPAALAWKMHGEPIKLEDGVVDVVSNLSILTFLSIINFIIQIMYKFIFHISEFPLICCIII